MRTNADLTIYHKAVDASTRSETWTSSQVRRIAWEDRRGARVSKDGNIKMDEVAVYIPMARGAITIRAEDVIIRGLVSDVIGPTFTITDLKKKYINDCATVRSVDKLDLGSINMRHWMIGAS
jgi:hypothetical protein